jgi:TolB protein
MRIILLTVVFFSSLWLAPSRSWAAPAVEPLDVFENHTDVGTVRRPGSVVYDASKQNYTVTGGGWDMWLAADAFQFVWKKVSGDVTLTADISFANLGGNPHKKAVLIFRQTLDNDSAYADVALHANGLTSLQYRDEKGGRTREIQSNISATKRLRIAKRGDYVYMSLAADAGGEPQVAGGWLRVPLQGTFYVGIGVCSHDKNVEETAVFSNVDLMNSPSAPTGKATLYSTLEVVPIETGDRRVIYIAPDHFEAPNWTRDGAAFVFNRNGRIERLPVAGGKPEVIDTGFAIRCNNDHGISPDGTQLAISDQSQKEHRSLVYIGDFDIYTIPAAGGSGAEETRLTTAKGLDDGPEYSPDGKYIYFNSERTGRMQIWRMLADGSQQEQVTSDEFNNWFPHISPDGKWMVFLSYDKTVTGHPENKDVVLRLMPLTGDTLPNGKITLLAQLFGGQGTINVPSWSPDSKELAFVSYQLIPEDGSTK